MNNPHSSFCCSSSSYKFRKRARQDNKGNEIGEILHEPETPWHLPENKKKTYILYNNIIRTLYTNKKIYFTSDTSFLNHRLSRNVVIIRRRQEKAVGWKWQKGGKKTNKCYIENRSSRHLDIRDKVERETAENSFASMTRHKTYRIINCDRVFPLFIMRRQYFKWT